MPDGCALRFAYFEHSTTDVVETVEQLIQQYSIKGAIFIKDCDNHFKHTPEPGNYTTFGNVVQNQAMYSTSASSSSSKASDRVYPRPDNSGGVAQASDMVVDVTTKSYVSFCYDNVIADLKHGTLISTFFCTGGWSFLNVDDFLLAGRALRQHSQRS